MNKSPTRPDYPIKPLFVLGLVLLGHLLFCFATYDRLPEQIPVHFGPDGADRIEAKSIFTWLTLWIVNALLSMSLAATAMFLLKIPTRFINLPKKDEFMDLPAKAQQRVMYLSSFHTLVLTITSSVTLFLTHVAIYSYSIGILDRFPNELIILAGVVFLCEVFLMVTALTRAVKDEIEKN